MQPATSTVPQDIRATIVRVLAYMGALAILAIATASFFENPVVMAVVQPAPQPEWVTVERPHPAFELQLPDLAAIPSDYAILRRSADAARKDILSYGNAAGTGPYVMVEVYRSGSRSERFIDAPSEVAARLLSFTVVDDVKPAGKIDSKFGDVALVDFAIAARATPQGAARPRTRRCLGFARAFDTPTLQVAGWYCSAGAEIVDRATLACMLDRLTMLSSGGDPQVAALFAHAEVKRTFCGQRSPILAATPERETTITAAPRTVKSSQAVKLRGRLTAQR